MTAIPDQIRRGLCLQCGAHRYLVARTKQACEVRLDPEETEMSWPAHHFGDWTDKELKRFRLPASQWLFNRRTDAGRLERALLASQLSSLAETRP